MSDTTTQPADTTQPATPATSEEALNQGAGQPDAGAPQTPPAEDPKPALAIDPEEGAAPEETTTDVFQYQSTGDTGLDLALQFVGSLGFGPDHVAIKAAQSGDFDKLDKVLKGMGNRATGYENYLRVAKESYARNVESTKAATAESEQAVLAAAGGIDNWNNIVAWARTNGTPDELKQVNAALQGGKLAASAMASQLAASYKASGEAKNTKSALKDGAGSGGVSSSDKPLSPQEYSKAIANLTTKWGTGYHNAPEYAALRARRAAFRG